MRQQVPRANIFRTIRAQAPTTTVKGRAKARLEARIDADLDDLIVEAAEELHVHGAADHSVSERACRVVKLAPGYDLGASS